MKNKKLMLIMLLLLLTIGFASVNTVLDLNGKVDMGLLESDLDVVFKEVLLNNEKSDNTIIIENGKSFIYAADELTEENNTSNIDYVIMNQSHQYDVEVRVSCTSDYESYLDYKGTLEDQELPIEKGILIEAGGIKSGNVITELIKENTTSESLVLKCTLDYIPVSRDSVVEDEEYIISFDTGYEEKVSDIKVKYYGEYGNLSELTRSNYKFLGWYTEEDIKVESNSLVKIKENHTLHAKWEKICEYDPGKVWTFDYTGAEQEFTVPCNGNYKLETWGAQGGSCEMFATGIRGGYGAFASGILLLENNYQIYINIGGKPEETKNLGVGMTGGYNGGGSSKARIDSINNAGGGATHIAVKSGQLSTLVSDKNSVLIVSSGGGGESSVSNQRFGIGGDGGGIIGNNGQLTPTPFNCEGYGFGGTQANGGSYYLDPKHYKYNSVSIPLAGFGYGSDADPIVGGAGGGGGWYGGRGTSCLGGAGGGSSYIGNPLLTAKVMYCYNCTQSNDESTKTISTTCTSSTPTANCAKQGNGYAKITYLGE